MIFKNKFTTLRMDDLGKAHGRYVSANKCAKLILA